MHNSSINTKIIKPDLFLVLSKLLNRLLIKHGLKWPKLELDNINRLSISSLLSNVLELENIQGIKQNLLFVIPIILVLWSKFVVAMLKLIRAFWIFLVQNCYFEETPIFLNRTLLLLLFFSFFSLIDEGLSLVLLFRGWDKSIKFDEQIFQLSLPFIEINTIPRV